MEDINRNSAFAEEEEIFSLKDFFTECLAKWKWFVASILIFCCIGVLYILRQQPSYSRTMAVLIKDEDGGSSMGDLSSAFSSLGFGGSNTNVNNELISLTSPAVMFEVINRLGLQVNYMKKGVFHGTTLYGTTLPFIATFADIDEQKSLGFRMDYNPDGNVTLYKFYEYDGEEKLKYEDQVKGKIDGKAIRTPVGRVVLTPNPNYKVPKENEPYTMIITRSGLQSTVEYYTDKLKGDLADKDADVIDLTIKDVSIQRATDILNSVVEVYNENWMTDKNKIGVATSKFIDERLAVIERELSSVDDDISEYKSSHKIPDLKEVAKISLEQDLEMSNQMLEVNNELAMAKYVKEYVNNPANVNNVIPVNTGMGSNQLEQQIGIYNNVLLNRNNLAASSSESNPLVLDMDAQLHGLREAISKAVANQVTSLTTTLRGLQGAKGSVESQLESGPTQAKYLLSLERQQKVKDALYIYLLEKREENEIGQKYSADNTRIITPPYGSFVPVAPRKGLIMVVAFLLGLCIPGVSLYIAEATNTKVRARKDLDRMSAPFAGEIPYVGHRKRMAALRRILSGKKRKKGSRGPLETGLLAVKEGSRDAVSESFRIVRGNIDFMLDKHEATNIIMLTSFNPGSGKSFIAFNLAASFALKGKKVLIIDGDLRHGSVSQFVGMPSKGLSNYLTGNTDDWRSLVVADHQTNGVFVLPIGHRPPNPAELLDNGRIGRLLNECRDDYDYVFFDCPPVDIVVDTQIVEKYVDRTLFVVRAGLLEKKSVAEIDEIYKSKRFKQMSIILNGTDSHHSRHYHYGSYGYYTAD